MERSAGTLIRDFVVFQLKLALDGLKDLLAIHLAVVAVIVDLLRKKEDVPPLFYRVVRMSERFERWLNLHRVKGQAKLPSRDGTSEDTPLGPVPDADSVIEELEILTQRKTGRNW